MESSVVPQMMLCLLIEREVYHALDLTEDNRLTIDDSGLDGAVLCQYFLVLLTGGKATGT